MLTYRQKADIAAIGLITVGLPLYYKVKFLLDDRLTWAQALNPAGLFEFIYSFSLACILVVLYRKVGPFLEERAPLKVARLVPLLTLVMSGVVAVLFTRFFSFT